MSKTHTNLHGLGLAEAVQALRADLLAAQQDPAHPDIRFPIREITIKLQVGAVRTADGRAGFRVPVVDLDLGGSGGWRREELQTITVVFGQPVDPSGEPVSVVSTTEQVKG